MARPKILGLLAGAMVLATLTGCANTFETYRFRMTVEVDTPQGLRTGSSVYEVLVEKNNSKLLSEERAGGTITRGDAVVVDLPSGPLFVLNKGVSETLGAVVTYVLAPSAPHTGIDSYVAVVRELAAAPDGAIKGDLPRKEWPKMVRFRDLTDPKSELQIDAEAAGVRRITVENTRAPLTTGIAKRLPWLDHLERYQTDPSNPFSSTLPSDFGGFRLN